MTTIQWCLFYLLFDCLHVLEIYAKIWTVLNSNSRRTVKSILLVRKLLGLIEMMFGLVNATFSLAKWQAVKMIFFAPWILQLILGNVKRWCGNVLDWVSKNHYSTYWHISVSVFWVCGPFFGEKCTVDSW